VRQHVMRSALGQHHGGRFALRLFVRRDARCVGPMSATSRKSLRAPAPRWFSMLSPGSSPAHHRGDRLFHAQSDSLRRTAVAAEPLASLSPLSRESSAFTRADHDDRGQRSSWCVRVNGAHQRRPEIPFIEQEPSPRNALSNARLEPGRPRGLATASTARPCLFTPHGSLESGRVVSPCTLPRCRRDALLWISAWPVDFCNLKKRRAGTPDELSILALPDIIRCRLCWPRVCVSAFARGRRATTGCRHLRGRHRGRGPKRFGEDDARVS